MTITERRNHFFHKLDESCEAWDRVARDYAQGYETALSNYGQIKAKEAKQNKEKARCHYSRRFNRNRHLSYGGFCNYFT